MAFLLFPTKVDAACTLRSKSTNASSHSLIGANASPQFFNTEFEMVDGGVVTTNCGNRAYDITVYHPDHDISSKLSYSEASNSVEISGANAG
jgi:hypothetical protein